LSFNYKLDLKQLPKKSNVLTRNQTDIFLLETNDTDYLMIKVNLLENYVTSYKFINCRHGGYKSTAVAKSYIQDSSTMSNITPKTESNFESKSFVRFSG